MPMLDEWMEKLTAYQGSNPKPADFDAFWDDSIREMKAVDPDITITPAQFQSPVVDCYDLYFTGVHGARVYAKLLKPKFSSGKCPAALNFHGYHRKSGDWVDYLAYAASGFVVAALDCRGQAGNSQDIGGNMGNTCIGHLTRGWKDSPDKMLFRDIFLDTAQLAGIVMDMDEVDQTRVCAYGGSQGGGLAIACAALEPRVHKLAAFNPFLCDYKRAWELDMTVYAYAEIKAYFRENDPQHLHEDAFFTKMGYIDIQHLAPRIQAQTLMVSGLRDVVCPPESHFAVYNKLTCKKKMIPYPDFGHEELPGCYDMVYQFLATE